ncbi:MAG: DsbA family protein [Candidatus Altimarinota bacterium]
MSEIQNNNSNNGSNAPYIVIIILLIVIAVLAFFVGKGFNTGSTNTNNNTSTTVNPEDIELTIIGDTKCADCPTQNILESIKQFPAIASAKITEVDFSDAGTEELMKANQITKLPAFLLNTDNISDLKQYLTKTPTGLFNLDVGATHDPYAKRSDRGFLVLNDGVLDAIKKDSRIYGNENAEILWVEYSDINCGYCAKLHNDGTHATLFKEFGDKLALAYQYFAIFNREAPVILECIADQKGTDVMYETIKKVYKDGLKDKAGIAGAVEGLNNDELTACIDSGKYTSKIDTHMKMGSETFGVTGTPGNILINTKTGEYAKLPGAYPVADFERTIKNLLIAE